MVAKANGRLIQDGWEGFESACVPSHAGDRQRDDMKNSFYAGALYTFKVMCDAANRDDHEEIKLTAAELKAFADSTIEAMLAELASKGIGPQSGLAN